MTRQSTTPPGLRTCDTCDKPRMRGFVYCRECASKEQERWLAEAEREEERRRERRNVPPTDILAQLRTAGATHIWAFNSHRAWFAFRPAPGFPGMLGQATVWPEHNGGAWHVEPWILSECSTIPENAIAI